MYNAIVAAPGQSLLLGTEGGKLLLQPPAHAPGAMSLTDLQNRTWHLLREDGPDTGFAPPTTGDFTQSVVTRDLNIALGQFISETGLAPDVCDRMQTFPVYAVMDYPVPPDLVSITKIDYNPAGSDTYTLIGYSMEEFERVTGGVIPQTGGQPRYYRQPFAGYIRLQPAPTQGNAVGPGIGTIAILGTPIAGQEVTATITNGDTIVTTLPYTVQNTDTPSTIATGLSNAINTSAAVTGAGAFLAPTSTAANVVQITALAAPGTQITIVGAITGTGASVVPNAAVNLSPNGDTMTFYYSSLGSVLVNPGDTPGIPPMFHMALVYRVLMDYWRRKQDLVQAKEYERMYGVAVVKAKSYTFDSNRATQPTIAGEETYGDWPEG